ncbi:MAG: M14 family zinc carboxypeptidase, partial [Candidatus Cloacimonetes bacterium]|nr:M14 family zinc carboxypeptidase [Candidatus Cloacimonadota bacterium]
MKHMIVTICITLMVLGLFAYPIRIQSWKMDEDIKTLNSLNVSIDYVNRQTGVIHAYVRNSSEHDKVSAAGILAIAMPDAAKEYARQLWEETKDSREPMRNYYSLAEYHTFMQQTAAQYPNICSLVQFGTSEQNRPLYFMKISDNVSQEENEPEIKLVSSIHGDEVVGFDLLIRLIQLLTAQYGTNTRITNIVNNTELWINPM